MNNTISGNGISKDQLKWFYALVGLFAVLLGWSFMNGMLFMTGLPVVFLMMLLASLHRQLQPFIDHKLHLPLFMLFQVLPLLQLMQFSLIFSAHPLSAFQLLFDLQAH